MAKKLVDGKKVHLLVQHGDVVRELTGTLRKFETTPRWDPMTGLKVINEETRWELVDATDDRRGHPKGPDGRAAYDESLQIQRYEAIGIDPENVVNVEDLT